MALTDQEKKELIELAKTLNLALKKVQELLKK